MAHIACPQKELKELQGLTKEKQKEAGMFLSKGSLAEACNTSPSTYIENRVTQPQPGPIFSPVFRIQGQAGESFLKS